MCWSQDALSKCHDVMKAQQLEIGFKVGNKLLPGQFNFSGPHWQSDTLKIGQKGCAELILKAR